MSVERAVTSLSDVHVASRVVSRDERRERRAIEAQAEQPTPAIRFFGACVPFSLSCRDSCGSLTLKPYGEGAASQFTSRSRESTLERE